MMCSQLSKTSSIRRLRSERQQPGYRVVGIDGQAKRRGNRSGNEPRLRQRAKIDEADLALEARKLTMRHGKCDRGLADAAGADDGDEPMQGQLGRDLLDGIVSANHLREWGGHGPERGHSRAWLALRQARRGAAVAVKQ